MGGPIEADEFYVGGVEKWKHAKNKTGIKGGTKGKTAVVGMKDRATNQITAKPIESVDAHTIRTFVNRPAKDGSLLYTDDSNAYAIS